MARYQYRYNRTITKLQWKGRHTSNCESIYEDDQTQGNNNEHLIRGNRQDLQGRNIEDTWST